RATSEIILVRFDPGELLLEGLREVIKAEAIGTAVVVSGIGTFSDCRIHQSVAGYPPNLLTRHQDYLELKGCYEIAAIQGIIANGEPHLHVTLSEGHSTIAGHLEDGCRVMTLAEIAILRVEGVPARRKCRGPERIRQLTAEA
ncbi:MAG TPA: PPC domain-containing DNA-binding protein, partial [Candidatus Sulfotelmatobacter sp.]|nr:PPC domain-containing DNA-binding protein [Candidatus Sulfotelmatobacter sp.]